ncbi:metal/formaldehyde-sensitive transcriptional repressor [Pelagibacterium sp. H642]|uniref:metal/formaldehyde-sensitive transcriptional repressor n=1 Tax=Pelagibacterium sp. H642 TaxID=1881069 RepID=UPI002814A385|nr:metal/formaldehyde-sensitive transcriptional repressor [Pelagibacterium sp. H642]WMT92623.1 metal/formaldehyde-sensitive transcriptional repressor [Pelagibacterium sp. H642]
MPNRPEDKKRILTRVRRIKGQCEALERALEEGVPCGAILQQIAAVRGGMNGLMAEVLETHIRDEFGGESADSQEKTRDLMGLVRSYLK